MSDALGWALLVLGVINFIGLIATNRKIDEETLMGMPVVTVASGGLPVVDVTGLSPKMGMPVTEAALGYGTAVTKVASGGMPVAYDVSTEASSYIARAAGIDTTHKSVMTGLINGLKADGTWSIFDVIQFYAHQTSALGLLNLVSSSYNGVLIGAPAFTADRGFLGVDGSATVAINTQFNPSTAPTPKMTQNSAHLSFVSLTDVASANSAAGAFSGTVCYIWPRFTDGSIFSRINNTNTAGYGGAAANSIGHYIGVRNGPNTQQGYKGGVLISSDVADASAAVPNLPFYAIGGNQAGTVIGWGGRQAVLTIGGALTAAQAASVTTRFRTALTALGVP